MTSPIFERYHVLVVPGWQNSGPEHWQSRWQDAHPAWQRVQQADWLTPSRADWVATLDAAVRAADRPVLLVAHSLGCATTAHWAAQHPDSAARVAAAWLVAPADTERADAPPAVAGFAPLPFASQIIASDNDPYCAAARADALARQWGSALTVLPAAGHINTDAGFGPWPEGLAALADWLATLPLAQP
jgi:predicted alpha/beta hydrolase family esterase